MDCMCAKETITVEVVMLDGCSDLAPTGYAKEGDAGLDIRAAEDGQVSLGRPAIVRTGLCMNIPKGYEGQVLGRSGNAFKEFVTVGHVGTIDAGYQGEIKLLVQCLQEGKVYKWKRGDRLCQMVIRKCEQAELVPVLHFSTESERGTTGFGSSGLN